jgi:hypothetical protein
MTIDAVGRDEVLPILRRTHFFVVIDPTGSSTVSDESDTAAATEEVAERVRTSVAGVEQMLTGFFHIWSGLVFDSPFADVDSEYRVEDLGGQVRLSLKEGSASLVTLLARDFAITELKATTSELEGTVRPHWSKEQNKFSLISYDATYKGASGAPQELTVKIDTQIVDGFELPAKVAVSMTLPSGAIDFPFNFTNYQVKKL